MSDTSAPPTTPILQGKALVVDDAPANRDFLERLMAQARFDVVGASTGVAALEAVASLDGVPLVLALVDMQLPDMHGLRLTTTLRTEFPDICIVVATMHDGREWMDRAFEHGCDVYLVKPHGFMDLYRRLATEGVAGVRATAPTVIDQYGQRPFRPKTTP